MTHINHRQRKGVPSAYVIGLITYLFYCRYGSYGDENYRIIDWPEVKSLFDRNSHLQNAVVCHIDDVAMRCTYMFLTEAYFASSRKAHVDEGVASASGFSDWMRGYTSAPHIATLPESLLTSIEGAIEDSLGKSVLGDAKKYAEHYSRNAPKRSIGR